MPILTEGINTIEVPTATPKMIQKDCVRYVFNTEADQGLLHKGFFRLRNCILNLCCLVCG